MASSHSVVDEEDAVVGSTGEGSFLCYLPSGRITPVKLIGPQAFLLSLITKFAGEEPVVRPGDRKVKRNRGEVRQVR